MYDIVNKAQNLTLPVVAVNMTGISRDTTRVFNKLDNIYNPLSEVSNSGIKMPIPINIEVSMSILARYMQDMDQILSNFIPYNNPYIILSWKEPSSSSEQVVEIRSEVLWSGSISLTEPTDIAYSEKFRIVADTSFTIKGWLFKDKNEIAKQIFFIDTNFVPLNRDLLIDEDNYDTFFAGVSSIPDIERFTLSAVPALTNAYYTRGSKLHELTENFVIANNYNNSFTLYGNNLSHTTSILLSTSNTIVGSLTSVTSTYTGTVSGYKLDAQYYNLLSDNILTIDLPPLTGACDFNIIVNNDAGWVNSYTINSFTFTNL